MKKGGFPLRHAVQAAFLLLCAWIGIEFALFMRNCADPWGAAPVAHPPGAEGFLPISALLSLKYWILTGRVCELHPAGLFIFIAILAIGLLLKKAFCSWLCPVGTLSEALGRLGRKLFGRTFELPKALDLPLRAVKYLLLAFFLWTTWSMGELALRGFLYSPFNAAADLRMYLFFARISATTAVVLAVLVLASLLVRNVWCRYLCPYGALLGVLSLASPVRITREASTCTGCKACTRVCPSRIQVHSARRVHSDECTGCYQCVEACPVKETLEMRGPAGPAVPKWVFACLVTGLFVAVTGLAMLAGQWRNVITPADYRMLLEIQEGR